jgi:CDP-diacylglycerol--serine O-phosphatidyltransferase
VIKQIPNVLTVCNLFLGIIAILLAFQGEQQYVNYAAITVIIGMLLDGLDGRMARILNAESEFGKELDSLSDLVTFGVAPALIMYVGGLQDIGILGLMVTAAFPICGALRLARFNVHTANTPGFFVGLPITAAGGALATLALYNNLFSEVFLTFMMLGLSILMVSSVKYPNFKKVGVPKSTYWVAPILVVVVATFGFLYPTEFPKIVAIPLVLYAIYGLKKSLDFFIKRWNKRKKDEEDQVYRDSL